MKNIFKVIMLLSILLTFSFSCSEDDSTPVADIASFLSTSKTSYNEANDGDWIQITEDEYNNLALNIKFVSKLGTTDTEYDAVHSNSNTSAWTISNDNNSIIPSGSFVFAFKYKAANSSTESISGFKVKQSDSVTGTFSDLGSALPTHSVASDDVYFVLKNNEIQTAAQNFLGFYKPNGVMGITSDSNTYYFDYNDSNTLSGPYTGYLFYQGLSTTEIQW